MSFYKRQLNNRIREEAIQSEWCELTILASIDKFKTEHRRGDIFSKMEKHRVLRYIQLWKKIRAGKKLTIYSRESGYH